MALSQDLDDYKLEAEINRSLNLVVHRHERADWARGLRKVVVEEKWSMREGVLGAGSFGTVHLQRRQTVNKGSRLKERAVKQLRKSDMERTQVDFRKELLALVKFSRAKVCDGSVLLFYDPACGTWLTRCRTVCPVASFRRIPRMVRRGRLHPHRHGVLLAWHARQVHRRIHVGAGRPTYRATAARGVENHARGALRTQGPEAPGKLATALLCTGHSTDLLEHICRPAWPALVGEDWRFRRLEARLEP